MRQQIEVIKRRYKVENFSLNQFSVILVEGRPGGQDIKNRR